jgi:CBS domain-containing protein
MSDPRSLASIATRPAVVCTPRTTLADVAALLRDHRVGCVVVVDDDQRPVGICTDRDLVVRALADRWPAETPVAAAMTEGVLALDLTSPVAEAAEAMERRGVRRVPVLDAHGRVAGVASLDDLVRSLAHDIDHVVGALTAAPTTP